MSGYAKHMMQISQAWLKANPVEGAPLRLPKVSFHRATDLSAELAQVERSIVEARRLGDEEIRLRAEQLRADLVRLQEEARQEQREFEQEALALVSQPYLLGHGETQRDDQKDDPVAYGIEAPWLLAWGRDGHNVFDLSADFCAAMLLTDPRQVDLPSLRLPFRGVLFTIPDRFAVGTRGTSYTKVHVVELADSRQRRSAEPQVGDAETSGVAADDVLSEESIDEAPSAPKPALAIYATDGAQILFTVAPRDQLSWDQLEELPDDVEADVDRQVLRTVQRIVFGAVAYATLVDRAIVQEERGSPRRRSGEASIRAWTIGRTIRIDPVLVRAARAGAREVAFRIKSRFIVRGHYRDQAHGPGRSLRTSRWIAPFWKGPEEGAQLVHTYEPTVGGSTVAATRAGREEEGGAS